MREMGFMWVLLGTIAVVVALLIGVDVFYGNVREDFEHECLAAHHNAHVTGSPGKTLFCLGPNGEVWDTR